MGSILERLKKRGALRTEFQPIVTVNGGSVHLYALEALTRGPRGTTMERADVLFEYVRRKGHETQIDLICIAQALAAMATLPGEATVSINIHGSTLCGIPGFAEKLLTSAQVLGIPANRLMLEILEHRGHWDMKAFRATLVELQQAGVRVALDDLGAGASNYRMIIDCHPDHLKIDRYIVAGCSSDPVRLAVLRSIVGLARECGSTPIAEGVENSLDLEVVRDLGIDKIQGWLYAKSMTPRETATSPFLCHS